MYAMASPVLVLSGFEPFGGDSLNASWEVARRLDGMSVGGARVVAVQLPCVFGDSVLVLRHAIRVRRPAWVLSLGQAAGRAELSIERVAINVDDARIPDNAGVQPIDRPVVPGGPAAYFTRLPLKAMAAAARARGVPAGVSQTAGTFVCNHVFYGLLHSLRRSRTAGGFMHVPVLPEQAAASPGCPTLALDDQLIGTLAALEAMVNTTGDDLPVAGGAIA